MSPLEIIDIHVHVYPDAIAQKAADAVGRFYSFPMMCDGTAATARKELDRAGIRRACVHSVATAPKQCESILRFVLSLRDADPERVIPFAALHPDQEDLKGYVDRCLASGIRGFKIHPDIQGFRLDEDRVLRMISFIEGCAPLLIHTGDRRYDNSGPERMCRVMDRFPALTAICAHLGGYSEWDRVLDSRLSGFPGVYVDTSSSLFAMDPEKAVLLIRHFGTERTLFGSDYPMWYPAEELKKFFALRLSDDEKESILHKNAERLLCLKQ